jgi:hypothetical protein
MQHPYIYASYLSTYTFLNLLICYLQMLLHNSDLLIDLDYELQPYAMMTRTYYMEFDPMNVCFKC